MNAHPSDHEPIEHRLRRLGRVRQVAAPADLHDRVMSALAGDGLGEPTSRPARDEAATTRSGSLSRWLDSLLSDQAGSDAIPHEWSPAWSSARFPLRMALASAAFLALTALNLFSLERMLGLDAAWSGASTDMPDVLQALTDDELLEELGWSDYTYPTLWSPADE